MTQTLLVVGGGLAGAKAAEGARAQGFEGRLVLAAAEAVLPYERPPLSKEVLRGEKEPESAQVFDEAWYATHQVELLLGSTVESLDAAARQVRLSDGSALSYDQVILATGAEPRRLDVPGADKAGVRFLRTVQESVALRAAIAAAGRVAVIGAGWIGTEVAASARQLGTDVVLIDPLPVPLQRVLGDEIGAVFAGLHADHGVRLRLGAGVAELRGSEAVSEVVLSDGSVEAVDLVVVGVGVRPRVELASQAGLDVADGIVVDATLRASAPGVLAAGDVASAWHPLYDRHIRVEHWANALNQGTAAGASAAGSDEPYARLPYFFSDQYDLGLEYAGLAGPDDAVAVRGDVAAREFVALYHRDGVVTAALAVNVWDVLDELRPLIEAKRPVDVTRIPDPEVPYAEL